MLKVTPRKLGRGVRETCLVGASLGGSKGLGEWWKVESESEVAQLCPTLCDPIDCSLPGSSARGILQARVLEWVAVSFSKRSSQPRDQTQVSHIAGRPFTI